MTNHTVWLSWTLSSTIALIPVCGLGCDEAPPPSTSGPGVGTWIPYPAVKRSDAGLSVAEEAGAPELAPASPPADAGAAATPPAPAPLAVLGAACVAGTSCASGYCADGVCCDIACTGTCIACNLDGLAGLCSPVKDAPDPGTCDGSQICGPERTCGQPEHEACATDATCAYGACRTYFLDNDGDGYGTAPISRCDREPAPPPGYALRGGDCCDTDANVYPGELTFYPTPSACGTFDYDCDGTKKPKNPACGNGCGVACLHTPTASVFPTGCR